jgi:hypothetical protein
MTTTRTWTPLLLALALAIAPTTALAGYHEDPNPSPAEDFAEIQQALDEGEADRAQSAWERSFAEREGPQQAHRAVDRALDDVRETEPGSADYAYASQTIEKATLAVSAHVALATEDPDEARTYFAVLTDKFGNESLTESRAALADASQEDLPDAQATLETEYTDLITAKVYAETEETAELIDAEPVTAAKEAGEAYGYALSLLDAVEADLGDEAREELAELGNKMLAEDQEAVEAEAEEVLDTLAAHGVHQLPAAKTQARQAFLSALDKGEIDRAETIYEDSFAEHASEYASDAHDRIQRAFEDIENASGANRTVQHQILAKSLLAVGWHVGFTELAEEETDTGLAYLALLVDKFDDPEDPGELATALGHVEASEDPTDAHLDAFRQTATDTLTDKVTEEIDEVFINWDDRETAREKAIEALVYYHPIHDQVAHTLSEDDADHLRDELEGLYEATTAGDKEEAEHEAEEARGVLTSFANAGQEVSQLDRALQDIGSTLDIITVEIEEYVEYKEKGDDEKAQEEIDESKAFIAKAKTTFEDHREQLEAIDADAAEALATDLGEIETRLENEEELASIPDVVERARERLSAFDTVDEDRPAVDVRIGDPEPADEGFRVPIQLVDFPTEAYAFQATITYDADALTVRSADIPVDVGSHTIEDGQVRFNAASPDAEEDPVVAELLLDPADANAEPELSIDVEEIADDQGDPFRVGNVTGQQLELASASTDATASNPTPAAGVGLLLAGLTATALLARRP